MNDPKPGETPAPKFTDPFAFDEIEFRAGPTNERKRLEAKNNGQEVPAPRTQAVCYITAEAAAERLDAVCDSNGWLWSDTYREVFAGDAKVSHIECTITINLMPFHGDKPVTYCRTGVGEGKDDGKSESDPVKTAYTDAFKRAASKLGIGRFLKSLPKDWVEYDPQWKQITEKGYDALRKSYDDFLENGPRRGRRRGARQASTAVRATSPAPAANGTPRAPQAAPSGNSAPVPIDRMTSEGWTTFWTNVRGMGYSRDQVMSIGGTNSEELKIWKKAEVDRLYAKLKELSEQAAR